MIQVENITVQAGKFSLAGVSLHVPAGSYGALMGRTGCGKSTLLEAIAGLKPVQSGRILLGGRDVTRERPSGRGIGYVPQDGALFSTMTVREHLAFALAMRRTPRAAIERRVDELAGLIGIGYLLARRPFGLSGGERQRVALGRALSFRPRVLLLDEPLSAVDEERRGEMYELLRRVQRETGVTALHVTHNPDEARQLADCVFVLHQGKISHEHQTQRTSV
jgi:ABC-type sugar transport system ATPase subunit